MAEPSFKVAESDRHGLVVSLHGDWTFDNAKSIEQLLNGLSVRDGVEFRCGGVGAIDLSGAWLLYSKSLELNAAGYPSEFSGFKETHLEFLGEIIESPQVPATPAAEPLLSTLTRPVAAFGRMTVGIVGDLGQMAAMIVNGARRPSVLALRETVNQLYDVGLRAIPIIALMSFLIGLVIAYQASTQLSRLGADAFTIDLVALSILREMGVMLTAIMVAGRSGSAFAASLGAMKLNEETDAMQIMGLSLNGTLVLPRVMSLVIAMPLLTGISNLAGLAGAWAVCVTGLNFSTDQFLDRLVEAVDATTVMVGLSKAPVFGALIAAVGTLRGLQVVASAEELGRLTTRAVVEAIFLVIMADALFSVIYTELDI